MMSFCLLPSYFFLPLGILSILLILSSGDVAAHFELTRDELIQRLFG
jgi:hypothetical protein